MVDVSTLIDDQPYLYLGSRLKRLGERLQAQAAALSSAAGCQLAAGQAPILAALATENALTVGDLAQAIGLSQPAVTKALSGLTRTGLVELVVSEADRRRHVARLTKAGRLALEIQRRTVWPELARAVEALAGATFLAELKRIEAELVVRPLTDGAWAIPPQLRLGNAEDAADVATLMNRAYRGAGGVEGWTTDASYIAGERTNAQLVRADLAARPQAQLLLWRDNGLLGCVWLEPEGEGTWYLGSLTVAPEEQNGGRGRALLAAAEAWVTTHGGVEIRMTVLNVRDTLIAWYRRRGYELTARTEPFPYGDERFGTPRRDDLHFVVLRKRLV